MIVRWFDDAMWALVFLAVYILACSL